MSKEGEKRANCFLRASFRVNRSAFRVKMFIVSGKACSVSWKPFSVSCESLSERMSVCKNSLLAYPTPGYYQFCNTWGCLHTSSRISARLFFFLRNIFPNILLYVKISTSINQTCKGFIIVYYHTLIHINNIYSFCIEQNAF